MKLTYPTGLLRDSYDRSMTVSVKWYGSADLAPHAFTNRYTYSIPSGKIYYFASVHLRILRSAVATTGDLHGICVAINVTSESNIVASLTSSDNTLYAVKEITYPINTFLGANNLIISTYDFSVGGTVQYRCTLFGYEFTS